LRKQYSRRKDAAQLKRGTDIMTNTEWPNELPADYDWSKLAEYYDNRPPRLKPLRKPLIEGAGLWRTTLEMLACTAIAGACIGAWITLALIG
jgi:hypothetical protein